MKEIDKARIVLSQLEVSKDFITVRIPDKITIDISSGRKFVKTKKGRNVYDWNILVVRIIVYDGDKNIVSAVEKQVKKTFGIDIIIRPTYIETILLTNLMSDVTEPDKLAVLSIVKKVLNGI